MPQRLMGAAEGNDAGHWEPYRLVAYNEQFLQGLHSSWHDWRPLDLTGLSFERKADARKDILKIIEDDYGNAKLFVVKDPRICRFPTFFMETLEEAGIDVSPILIFRNPLEVFSSLEARKAFWPEGFSMADGALLWLSHVLEAERSSRGYKRTLVTYDALLGNWRDAVSKVAKETKIRFPASSDEVAPLVDEFLSEGLRHHAKSAAEVAIDPVLRGWCSEAFEALIKLSANPGAKDPQQTLDRIYFEFRRALPILENLLATARSHAQSAVETERELRRQSDQQRDELNGKAEELAASLANVQEVLFKARGEIETLTSNVQEMSAQREQIGQVNEQLLFQVRKQLRVEDGDNRSLDQLVGDLISRFDEVSSEAAAKGNDAERLGHLAEERASLLTAARSELEDLKRRASESDGAAESLRSEINDLRQQLAQAMKREQALKTVQTDLADTTAALEGAQAQKQELQLRFDRIRSQMREFAQTQARLAHYKGEVDRLAGERDAYQAQADAVDRERNQARAEEQRLHNVLDAVYRSTSWRLTAPVRAIGGLPRNARTGISKSARSAWHKLPLPTRAKQGFKSAAFKSLPVVFRRTKAYKAWRNFNEQSANVVASPGIEMARDADSAAPATGYVPLLPVAPPANKPVRVVAFYLPQFHPIPENDEWWGAGFTEWTNVRPASPQFVGHYQPHVPGELGYYDLRDTAVQRRQIELAKLYGVEGFCFYFYWFGGKRLLEKPLENWLADKSLDLPFCLCWANENWSRRWDGLDREVLIAQDHSPQDDLAFIAEAAPYLRDPRYIRIDGKPLLLVYRPSLLPSARETAERWRRWCRENGVGEIFLAYTQSFETVDPTLYGFDAAVEFPPNNSAPPNVTDTVTPLREDFSANIYDWSCFPQRSETYAERKYPLFRSVCPSWDNTARRKSGASIFVNSTPALYRRWLENAIRDTVAHVGNPQERLVFVNAWNEWAEGAHLEPDAANGYAYLQETRNALEATGGHASLLPAATQAPVAIVIHAFYPDVLDEILSFASPLPKQHKIFATTTAEKAADVRDRLEKSGRDYSLRIVPNRGRDVLPFFSSFGDLMGEGFEFLVKVHTKKSLHRDDGDVWRRDLYARLLSPGKFTAALAAFMADPHLGMVGPEGHYVPMSTYLGSNEARILAIGERLGLSQGQVRSQPFFAGTMFMARAKAIEPLMTTRFAAEDFETEAGQIDGTLAHAIERGLALSVAASGMRLATDADLDGIARVNERYGHA
ncbi:glycoside hydrolase family 99-like domain-containing protein [Mesorhizobium sp. CN5-321]|uniref:glycoside hydrolase family 99-like domain-containing protein n=1 Tax=Mesorhizobium hunchu TaxID=3157708 RepID=UPI0032B800D5